MASDGRDIYGLSHFLSGQKKLEDVLYGTTIPGLFMIFAGPSVPNPTEILEKKYFTELLNLAKEHFDYVLLDCAPIGAAIEAAVIAKHCDGAILVVDAAQGIEAQTLANVYMALDHDLDVVPVINKIDLPSADPERVINEIEDVIGIEAQDAPQISAKTGVNVDQVLEQVVAKIPAPAGNPDAPLKALIFDSVYDAFKGVIVFCRLMDGRVR